MDQDTDLPVRTEGGEEMDGRRGKVAFPWDYPPLERGKGRKMKKRVELLIEFLPFLGVGLAVVTVPAVFLIITSGYTSYWLNRLPEAVSMILGMGFAAGFIYWIGYRLSQRLGPKS